MSPKPGTDLKKENQACQQIAMEESENLMIMNGHANSALHAPDKNNGHTAQCMA